MDLDDWKTNAGLAIAGAIVGGPVGLISSVALMYAKSLSKKKTSPPTGTMLLPSPPPREVHLAASTFMKSNPKLGTTKTVTILGKQYTLRAEEHPSAANTGGVAIYAKGG